MNERIPNSEIRNPKQTEKSSNLKTRALEVSDFPYSNLFRISTFGFRISIVAAFIISLITSLSFARDFPKPSPYPITWELKFEHDKPKRIFVQSPGDAKPRAYWYLSYTVTNNTDKEQLFLPVFELLTRDGRVIRSDVNVPQRVFDRIKQVEGKRFMEPFTSVGGEIRLGEDEARDGVAIWPEPDPRMGTFNLFVQGLSGETATLKDEKGVEMKNDKGRPIILRKTLELTYQVRGDELAPDADLIDKGSEWVMR
jgi:hypothetical protein